MLGINSYLKTALLLAALSSILIILGYAIGGSGGVVVAIVFSTVFNLGIYWFSSQIALKMAGAKPLDQKEHFWVHTTTQELSRQMQISSPKLYVSDNPQPNAFASGRNQSNAAVCLTSGLLTNLSQSEVRGVIAHELAHIKNNDILITTVAAVIAGAISSIGDLFIWNMFFGNDEENNPASAIVMIIFAPIIALIIQLAISRSREYSADKTAAFYTKQPQELASALIKIEQLVRLHPVSVNPAMANLYIQSPITLKGIGELFSTHPATAKRVSRLMNYNFS